MMEMGTSTRFGISGGSQVLCFVTYNKEHILWIRQKLQKLLGVKGHIHKSKNRRAIWQLKYAKAESLEILKEMYSSKDVVCLSRKRLKIEEALSIVGESLK